MSSAPQGPYTAETLTEEQLRPLELSKAWSRIPAEERSNDAAEEAQADVLNAEYERGRASVANRGDLLYTDNSAVVARLSAENERLRAALKSLTGSIDNWQNDHEVQDNAFWQAYEQALAAVEGDAA